MGLIGNDPPGATPLTLDDLAGLIPGHITTRGDLNEFEAANIQDARLWVMDARAARRPLDRTFVYELHRRMFGDTWIWAGSTRTTVTNIGVEPRRIATDLDQLIENTRFRIENKSDAIDRIGAEFHHRLVWIHPFPNGNGRHARLLADLLLQSEGVPPFSWGGQTLDVRGAVRDAYIAALREADAGNYGPLNAFVRS